MLGLTVSLAGRTMVSAQYPRFRPILDKFAPYQAGGTVAAPDGRSFKLSSNESPFGPLPSVLKVIAEAAGQVNRYPDNVSAELTEAGPAAAGDRRRARRGGPVRLALVRVLPDPVRPGWRHVGAGAAA
jgi:histidinol-phosphate aminotransferase